MSEKMDKLKEVAGDQELDFSTLEVISGGNKAQTEELWNFFMAHGKGDILNKYGDDHAAGIYAALKSMPRVMFSSIRSISNANAESDGNIYKIYGGVKFSHGTMMAYLKLHYSGGFGI